MSQYSPAFLSPALGFLKAIFTPARGRHSATARRRRSTRVRRYAPLPAPELARAPRLAPAAERIPAEEAALVRGYYTAFESERANARIQAEAQARLNRWTSKVPPGDLLAPKPPAEPAEPDDLRRLTRIWVDQQRSRTVAA